MNSNEPTSGFNCATCGKRHTYSAYFLQHMDRPQSHKCDLCGAVHVVQNYVAKLTYPGHVTDKTTQFELALAGVAPAPLPPEEPQVTDWIEGTPPAFDGYYHLRFPNGTEADRNWWWCIKRQVFLYDSPTGVILITFGAIGGYRGLDKPYNV